MNARSNAIRRRTSSLVLASVVATAFLLPTSGASAAPSKDPVVAARAALAAATEGRIAAEARIGEAKDEVESLEARVREMDSADEQLTRELADAKDTVRQFAVTAYIEGRKADMASAALDPTDTQQLMWKSTITVGHAATAQEVAEQFAQLKEAAGPRRAELAQTLENARAALVDANNDAIQAAAFERDAEARLAKAEDDARRAAEEAARRRAAAEAEAANAARAAARNVSTGPSTGGAPAAVAAPQASTGMLGNPTASELATLARIRRCESRGNYGIVSASGRYRGAYQFDYRTWAGVGGSGDPAAASPAEQDYRALLLLRARGTRPWPVCGR